MFANLLLEISCSIHLTCSRAKIYEALTCESELGCYWPGWSAGAEASPIEWRFSDGMLFRGEVLEEAKSCRLTFLSNAESVVTIELEDDREGGTILTLIDSQVPERWLDEVQTSCASVLSALCEQLDEPETLAPADWSMEELSDHSNGLRPRVNCIIPRFRPARPAHIPSPRRARLPRKPIMVL